MFLEFTSTKINNNHKLLSFSNFPLIFYKTLLFWGKKIPPPPEKIFFSAE